MSDTKENFINLIRWLAFLPLMIILFIIGYASGADVSDFVRKTFGTGLLDALYFMMWLPGFFMIVGARFLIPKHKKLATWLAIILWVGIVVWFSIVSYRVDLENQAMYQMYLDTQQQKP